jgi:hypothetical protein
MQLILRVAIVHHVLKRLAWCEFHRFSCGDADGFAGTRIASGTRHARALTERAKSDQLNTCPAHNARVIASMTASTASPVADLLAPVDDATASINSCLFMDYLPGSYQYNTDTTPPTLRSIASPCRHYRNRSAAGCTSAERRIHTLGRVLIQTDKRRRESRRNRHV